MFTPLLRRKLTVAGSACFLAFSAAHAQVLFNDNFNTGGTQSDDINFQYNSGIRQSGMLTMGGAIPYTQGVGGNAEGTPGYNANALNSQTQINNNTATLNGVNPSLGGAPGVAYISPNYNFNTNAGTGNFLSISFTLDPSTSTAGTDGTNWGAITFGASDNAAFGTSGSGARGQFVNNAGAHFGMLFNDNGAFQAFNGNAGVGSGTYSANPTTILTHQITFRITGLVGGNAFGGGDALIQAYADGGSTPFFSYTKTGGYTDNYVTMESYNTNSAFDNLQVTIVVPEPSTWVLAIVGTAALIIYRRRRILNA